MDSSSNEECLIETLKLAPHASPNLKSLELSFSGNSSQAISRRKMKHISMDSSSNVECSIAFQISGSAQKIKEVTPHPTPDS